MNLWIAIMMFLSIANFSMSLSIALERFGTLRDGVHGIKRQWAFIVMNIALLFKKKITVVPHLEYYSPYQATEHFYLLKTYKCSHEIYFKLISGSYTTIVPARGIREIDGRPFKPTI